MPYFSVLSASDYSFETSAQVYLSENSKYSSDDTLYFTSYGIDNSLTDYSALTDEIKSKTERESLLQTEKVMREDAYENALDVPENNLKAVKRFCELYKISADDKDAVSEVVTALEDNFSYTLKPGKVPYGEDYVNYFLLGSQKGYCQHFASAATLIFRYLGIPARYAEGYVIDSYDYENAVTLKDESVSDWITPSKDYSEVVEVSVPDSSGHAWVEIYVDSLGWVPVEATTAASVDEGGGFLSNLFSGRNPMSSASQSIAERVRKINVQNTEKRLKLLAIIVLALLLAAYFIRAAAILIKRHRSFNTDSRRQNLSNRYVHLYSVWQFSEGKLSQMLSYRDFIKQLSDMSALDSLTPDLCSRLEYSLFSGKEPEMTEYNALKGNINYSRKYLIQKMTFGKKLRFFFIKIG